MSSCVWIAFALSQLIGGPLDLLDAEPPPAARPGFVEVGTVRFHPGLREVEVDATLNLRGGFIEFLACGTGVKRHESLLSLDCDPIDLNAAILLLGIEPGVPPRSEDDLGPIEGPRVMLRLRYGVTLPDGRAAVRDVRAEALPVQLLPYPTLLALRHMPRRRSPAYSARRGRGRAAR